jgi:UDP-glucuronate decarboxylase
MLELTAGAETHESPSKIFCLFSKDGPKQRQMDISLAKRELEWAPTIRQLEGSEDTISYSSQFIFSRG